MKRTLVIFLSFLLIAVMIPSMSFAETRAPYAIYNSTDGSLTFYYDFIPDNVESNEVLYEGRDFDDAFWLDYYEDILTVTFDESFKDCTSISNTTWWFSGCCNLTEINGLEYFNTSNVTNMVNMFQDCSSLINLDLSTFNTTNVVDMQGMFWGCSSLKTLDLTSFNTANSNNMSNLFNGCENLTSIYASDKLVLNSTAKTESHNIFYMCSSLTGDFSTMLTKDDYTTEDEAISYFRLDTISNPGLFSTGKPFEVSNLKVSDLEAGQRIGNATISGTVTKDGNVINGTWEFVEPNTILKDTDLGTTEFKVQFVPKDFSFRDGNELIKTVKFAKKEVTPCNKKPICPTPCTKLVKYAIKTCVTVVVIKVSMIVSTLCRLCSK